jgi:5-deoxy-glucuronate isomerase
MSKRVVRATASHLGRNIFVHPGNSSMRQVSYGRIRLSGDQKKVKFKNEGQETGLICISGACEVLVGDNSFTLTNDDALYVPKGRSITVRTTSYVDLVECFAPVEGEYPLSSSPPKPFERTTSFTFLWNGERASRDQYPFRKQHPSGQVGRWHYAIFTWKLDKLAASRTCCDA